MKINSSPAITGGTSVMKKMAQTDKGPADKVTMGNVKHDDTLLMGDRLKDMKSRHDPEVGLALAKATKFATGGVVAGIGAGILVGASFSPIAGVAAGILGAAGLGALGLGIDSVMLLSQMKA